MGVLLKLFTASAAIVIATASALYIHVIRKRRRSLEKTKALNAVEAFNYLDINIVTTVKDCDHVVHELRSRSMKHKTLGFDCEWVTSSSGRQPVALLQLSSFDGYCALFRLCCFSNSIIPTSLRDLLQCKDIYKVGVAPNGDAKYLCSDYQTSVMAAIDVRYVVEFCGYQSGGLGPMTEHLLNVTLDKRWQTRCSNWEAVELTPTQVHYAASDAHAAIQIFVTVLENFNKRGLSKLWNSQGIEDIWEQIDEICYQYSDRSYTAKTNARQGAEGCRSDKRGQNPKCWALTRAKPLYHNCMLQAPDGELLCTCDTKKALWYIEKDLEVMVAEDPLTVRLRFEPVARATGDVGHFYRMKKLNLCVVCGATNSFIRKNIVPREYRKYLPEIMKDHASHDVLLLCMHCHQRSNIYDQVKRKHLAVLCDAPLNSHRDNRFMLLEDSAYKKVRTAAHALLVHARKHELPIERRKELEDTVLSHFPDQSELTEAMLQEASSLQNTVSNEETTKETHGSRVVLKYLTLPGGLLKFEEEWRTHFLATMNPKFMPELWSVHHNRDRLKVKWDQKRLDASHLKSMGVEW